MAFLTKLPVLHCGWFGYDIGEPQRDFRHNDWCLRMSGQPGNYRQLKTVSLLNRSSSVYTGQVCIKMSSSCKGKYHIQLKEYPDITHFLCKLQVQLQ